MRARNRRDASLVQIAAAMVGTSAAAAVVDQQNEHTYASALPTGVYESEAGEQLDVVGANGRRLIGRRTPEGVYVGGCLIADPRDLKYLADWLEEPR